MMESHPRRAARTARPSHRERDDRPWDLNLLPEVSSMTVAREGSMRVCGTSFGGPLLQD